MPSSQVLGRGVSPGGRVRRRVARERRVGDGAGHGSVCDESISGGGNIADDSISGGRIGGGHIAEDGIGRGRVGGESVDAGVGELPGSLPSQAGVALPVVLASPAGP